MSRLLDIFRRKQAPTLSEFTVTGRSGGIASYTGDPYANDVFRAGVDSIARIAAKFVLQPTATFSDGTSSRCDDRLTHLLQVRPNRYMSGYDFLYQLFSILYTKNNAYAYLQRNDQGQVVAIFPLHVSQCRHFEDASGTLFSAFTFANGRSVTLPYADVIHLRRHLNSRDVDGDSPAIDAAVSLADAQNRGIEASIRTSGQVKGIVKYSGSLGKSKLDELKREFEQTFLTPERSGGVITSDATFDYIPFETRETPAITSEDVKATASKIYNYLGISEDIVNATFDDSTFGAFEESVIEALALQVSLEFTAKIYPDRHNRRIECQTSRIRYLGNDTKNKLLKEILPMGVLSINESRDLLGLAPLPDGDYRIQSLNYASTDLVGRYQIARSGQSIVELDPTEEAEDDE